MTAPTGCSDPALEACFYRHLRFGWWSLFAFLTLGIVLECLHGYKIGWYLDADNETRRLLWTLSHAHGTLLALVHIAFGVTVRFAVQRLQWRLQLASSALVAASILLPGGFFLGGAVIYAGDPGIGIFLVPVGAFLLMAAVVVTALSVMRSSGDSRTTEKKSNKKRP